jgi:hypothetical protein
MLCIGEDTSAWCTTGDNEGGKSHQKKAISAFPCFFFWFSLYIFVLTIVGVRGVSRIDSVDASYVQNLKELGEGYKTTYQRR